MTFWDERKAADELRRAMRSAIPVEDPAHVSARRGRLVARIEQEIAQVPISAQAQERRKKVLRFGLAAAAAALIGISGSYLTTALSPARSPTAQSAPLGAPAKAAAVDAGSQAKKAKLALRTGPVTDLEDSLLVGSTLRLKDHQTANLTLPGGTAMQLSRGGELLLVEAETYSHQVTLGEGLLRVDVPEGQTQRRRVVIRTPHALVEVKGTLFFVDVQKDQDATTVSVERGEVLVHVEDTTLSLLPGQSWNSNRVGLSVETVDAGPASKSSSSVARSTAAVGTQKSASNSSQPDSTLAHQNALLEQAVRLEREGHTVQAEAVLSRLLKKYPQSPLRSTVYAELRRLRSLSDSAKR